MRRSTQLLRWVVLTAAVTGTQVGIASGGIRKEDDWGAASGFLVIEEVHGA